MRRPFTFLCIAALALGAFACADENEAVTQRLVETGYSESSAKELSTLNLTEEEVKELEEARQGGLDGTAATDIVKSLRERDLKFDMGTDMQVMANQGFSSTALVQLVDMEAIPRWTDDLRALKSAGVEDVTIVEIAKLKFQEKKEVLSGNEYTELKHFGMTDAGLLEFVRKGGTPQQLQTVREKMMLGTSEQEAMKDAGL